MYACICGKPSPGLVVLPGAEGVRPELYVLTPYVARDGILTSRTREPPRGVAVGPHAAPVSGWIQWFASFPASRRRGGQDRRLHTFCGASARQFQWLGDEREAVRAAKPCLTRSGNSQELTLPIIQLWFPTNYIPNHDSFTASRQLLWRRLSQRFMLITLILAKAIARHCASGVSPIDKERRYCLWMINLGRDLSERP